MPENVKPRFDRWLDTASGKRINLARPSVESVAIEDIAGALSRICRFGGHTIEFYSVAQHSVLVAELVARIGRPDLGLLALHHDSHEAYLGDMPTPLKKRLDDVGQYSGYGDLVTNIDTVIGQALGILLPVSGEDKTAVKLADRMAFQVEARRLLPNNGRYAIGDDDYTAMPEVVECPEPLPPVDAARQFLSTHERLAAQIAVVL
ncbi:hypothetical protein ACIA8G_21510 [Lentzea sp. NPDC051213]|uniref:hypothetical protein n=1 Tax=Lentzea sp. NPDC051213 TaxID=3364126 RepID=UPI0037ADE8BF